MQEGGAAEVTQADDSASDANGILAAFELLAAARPEPLLDAGGSIRRPKVVGIRINPALAEFFQLATAGRNEVGFGFLARAPPNVSRLTETPQRVKEGCAQGGKGVDIKTWDPLFLDANS